MGFVESVGSCLRKSFEVSGRASRAEFWYWMLFLALMNFAIILSTIFFQKPFTLLYLSLMPAYYSVSIRRLHDVGHSGMYILRGLIPLIGPILLFLQFVKPGDEGENEFGPVPVPASPNVPQTMYDV